MKIAVYIFLDDNTREVLSFYQQVFKCKEPTFQTWGDSPMKDMTPEESHDKIMHGSLDITSSVIIWASDRNPAFNKPPIVVGDNVQISLILNDKKETERVFAELSKGATNIGPISDMPWGGYFGHCTDKFGINWMFNCAHPSKDGKREIEEAAASLKEAASQAMESAAALERLVESMPEKKSKAGTEE